MTPRYRIVLEAVSIHGDHISVQPVVVGEYRWYVVAWVRWSWLGFLLNDLAAVTLQERRFDFPPEQGPYR